MSGFDKKMYLIEPLLENPINLIWNCTVACRQQWTITNLQHKERGRGKSKHVGWSKSGRDIKVFCRGHFSQYAPPSLLLWSSPLSHSSPSLLGNNFFWGSVPVCQREALYSSCRLWHYFPFESSFPMPFMPAAKTLWCFLRWTLRIENAPQYVNTLRLTYESFN